MKMTMLTYKTLRRFEREYLTNQYTPEQIETIEHAAYVANMNQCNNPEWTEADIFADFLRVLRIHKIEVEQINPNPTETETTNENEEVKTMTNAEFIAQVRAILNGRKSRSAWDRGVMEYAEELTAELDEFMRGGYVTMEQLATADGRKAALLNGAKDWTQYSYGGSALIYDYEIAERLCNPSELKRTRNGERNPNSRETWLDCQARALSQASSRVREAVRFVLWRSGKEVH